MSEQTFLTHLRGHFDRGIGDPLRGFRRKAWDKLLERGLPTRSHEGFQYVPLREFYLCPFQLTQQKEIDKSYFSKAILPECKHSHLVFIDGFFSLEHSDLGHLPGQIVVSSLEEALSTHGGFLQSYFTRLLKEENDPFALLNFALHAKGAFVYLPPRLQVTSSLQCLYVTTGREAEWICPRLHLALGAEAQMRCVVTHHRGSPDVSHCVLPALEISLEEGASLDLFNLMDSTPLWQFESVRATLKKDSGLTSHSLTFGSKGLRQSYRVELQGENSEANLNGLWALNGAQSAHTHIVVEHAAPHTRSMQKFKGLLNDHSQSSFEGKILVRPVAQKTQAYQLNHNLLLSQGAKAHSKPNLEIFADDVKASHGATISQLDEEQLFYLKTRGMDPISAKYLLTQGFCREMIDKIPYHCFVQSLSSKLEGS